MNQYIKENIILPISLHDTVITSLDAGLSEGIDGHLLLRFADGFFLVNGQGDVRTGPALVRFSGIDFDFSYIYVCQDERRREITLDELAGYIERNRLEIIDETYGYNQTRFICSMSGDMDEIQISIYHFHETVYEWDDGGQSNGKGE